MSARLSHRPGDFLDPHTGQYQIQSHISTGGMGSVYRAVDTFTGAAKAVKECDLLDDPRRKCIPRAEAVSIFLDEARCLEDLKHPGIPAGSLHPVRQTGLRVCLNCGNPVAQGVCSLCLPAADSLFYEPQAIDFRYYLVMEFVDGLDLNQAVARMARPLGDGDLKRICAWLLEAARVLAYVHQRKFAHCDVKPENLRIRQGDGQVFLLDFGLRRLESDSAKTRVLPRGSRLGTPGYAPPEQTDGRPTYASDIYALAMTALNVLTGLDPSHPLDQKELLQRRASHWVPSLPSALDELLYRSLSMDASTRPTAKTWVEVLGDPYGQHQRPPVAGNVPDLYTKQTVPLSASQKQTAPLNPNQPFSMNQVPVPPMPQTAAGAAPRKPAKPLSLRLAGIFAPLLQLALVGVMGYSVWYFGFRPDPSEMASGKAQVDARVYDEPNGSTVLTRLKGGERLVLRKTTQKVPGYWFRVELLNGKPSEGYIQRDSVQLDKPRTTATPETPLKEQPTAPSKDPVTPSSLTDPSTSPAQP